MDNTILCKRMQENLDISNKALDKVLDDTYKSGQAVLIAYLLHSIHIENFTLKEVIQSLYDLMDTDSEIKDYVYEQMKDIKN